jgi:hypothetical protein
MWLHCHAHTLRFYFSWLPELQNNDSLPADGYGYILLSVSQKTLSGYLYRDA